MSYLPDLRSSLVKAAHREHELQADQHASADRAISQWQRARIWSRAGARAVSVLLAIGVTVAITVVALTVLRHGKTLTSAPAGPHTSHVGSVPPQQPNVPAADWTYIRNARRATAAHDPTCSPFVRELPGTSRSAPTRALTSILGVLRRPPTPADKLPGVLSHGAGSPLGAAVREIYINYVRRARSLDGTSFYIVPAGNVTGFRSVPASCVHEEAAALDRELAHTPAKRRARILQLQAAYLAWENYQGSHPEGIVVAEAAFGGSGASYYVGVAGGNTVADIEQGHAGLGAAQTASGNTLYHGVVPNGVATVTLRYTASATKKAITITARVLNNVFAIDVPQFASELPQTITWRTAQGSIIKSVHGF